MAGGGVGSALVVQQYIQQGFTTEREMEALGKRNLREEGMCENKSQGVWKVNTYTDVQIKYAYTKVGQLKVLLQ